MDNYLYKLMDDLKHISLMKVKVLGTLKHKAMDNNVMFEPTKQDVTKFTKVFGTSKIYSPMPPFSLCKPYCKTLYLFSF